MLFCAREREREKLLGLIKPCWFVALHFGQHGQICQALSRPRTAQQNVGYLQCSYTWLPHNPVFSQHFARKHVPHWSSALTRDRGLLYHRQFVLPWIASVDFSNVSNAYSKWSSKTVHHHTGRQTLRSCLQIPLIKHLTQDTCRLPRASHFCLISTTKQLLIWLGFSFPL